MSEVLSSGVDLMLAFLRLICWLVSNLCGGSLCIACSVFFQPCLTVRYSEGLSILDDVARLPLSQNSLAVSLSRNPSHVATRVHLLTNL